jgi:polyisoprenoid-binding protein YceI
MKPLGLVLALGLLAASAHATEFNTLRAEQSRVSFAYKQMNVPMEGSFKRFGGNVSFDPARPAQGKAEISIDLASIDAGSDEANDEVAGKLWFDTKQFPTARFVSSSVKPLGDDRFEVAGKLSIKGRIRDVSTVATFRPQGANGVFDGSFVLRRADYGIGEGVWTDFGTVANEVQIRFRLVVAATGKK